MDCVYSTPASLKPRRERARFAFCWSPCGSGWWRLGKTDESRTLTSERLSVESKKIEVYGLLRSISVSLIQSVRRKCPWISERWLEVSYTTFFAEARVRVSL